MKPEAQYELMGRATELRSAFDRSFAVASTAGPEDSEQLLELRVGEDTYAVRVREILGLFAARKIQPLPSPAQELLGVTALRGAVLPIYSLGALLGYPATTSAPRWWLLAAATEDQQLGLAVEGVAGTVRVRRAELSTAAAETRSHIQELARFSDQNRAIISIHSVLHTIVARTRGGRAGS